MKEKKYLINNQIRAERVRVIDKDGKNLGVFPLSEALKLARDQGLDLVQITEKAEPPVVRILDYGKFLYQQKKESKKVQKKDEMKVVRLSFREGEHDLFIKGKKVDNFLKAGYKVRVDMYLRGREKAFTELAKEKLLKFLSLLEVEYRVIQEVKKVPRGFTVMIIKK